MDGKLVDYKVLGMLLMMLLGPLLLLGLLFPSGGDITILGETATNVEKNERIGYLPEESYLYRFLNAGETLDFYGRLFNMSKSDRRERVDRYIEMVGLTHARHRQLKEYSKGMTRRIGLAQALINDPDLVILDEPTSNISVKETHKVLELIRQLRSKGVSVIIVSHRMEDIFPTADRNQHRSHGGRTATGQGGLDRLDDSAVTT